jgi:hypothetical protein
MARTPTVGRLRAPTPVAVIVTVTAVAFVPGVDDLVEQIFQ